MEESTEQKLCGRAYIYERLLRLEYKVLIMIMMDVLYKEIASSDKPESEIRNDIRKMMEMMELADKDSGPHDCMSKWAKNHLNETN